jgi:hypothetical protein
MSKAILELEMPGSCAECPCKDTDVLRMIRCRLIHIKSDKYSGMAEGYAHKRRTDCPLKLVRGRRLKGYEVDTIEALQQENEHLQAQVARMREALIIANNYMPDIGHFCTCGKCKRCGADINYAGYEHCVKCARVIIDAALSDTPADYHNPADVEALIMAMEAIKAAWSDGSANAAMDKASGALAAIDKVIGGF